MFASNVLLCSTVRLPVCQLCCLSFDYSIDISRWSALLVTYPSLQAFHTLSDPISQRGCGPVGRYSWGAAWRALELGARARHDLFFMRDAGSNPAISNILVLLSTLLSEVWPLVFTCTDARWSLVLKIGDSWLLYEAEKYTRQQQGKWSNQDKIFARPTSGFAYSELHAGARDVGSSPAFSKSKSRYSFHALSCVSRTTLGNQRVQYIVL